MNEVTPSSGGMQAGAFQQASQRQAALLSMTARRSLELLQAPAAVVATRVQEALAKNPALEETAPASQRAAEVPASKAAKRGRRVEAGKSAELSAPQDFFSAGGGSVSGAAAQELHDFALGSASSTPTLIEHLHAQQADWGEGPQVRRAVEEIIGSLDANGYLRTALPAIARGAGVEPKVAEEALARVQALDPVGVGARNLAECLQLQLARRSDAPPLAREIAAHHLAAVAAGREEKIAKTLRVGMAEVRAAVEFLRRLQPRPGAAFALPSQTLAGDPELEAAQRRDGSWTFILAGEPWRQVRVRTDFAAESETRAARTEARRLQREAEALVRALTLRQATLLAVGRVIAARQQDFFEQGALALAPLTMQQVAAEAGLHQTTVSRAVAGKRVRTPHGIFWLRGFFSGAYGAEDGGARTSAAAVRARLREWIAQEDARRPLTDAQLEARFAKEGVSIARRTVAKHREALRILPARWRRR